MEVWILNGPMNAGGAESLIMELLRNKDSRVNVKLVVHSANNQSAGVYDEEIKKLNIPVYYLPSVGSVGVKNYEKAFKALIDKIGKPDVIHSNMNAVGGFICKVAKKCGIKNRIVHCHADIRYTGSMLSRLKSEIGLFIMKKYVNAYANQFWACSEAAAKRLFYKNKKYTVIPNVIDVQKYFHDDDKRVGERAKLNIADNEIAVGAVGRVAPIKNYEVIIDAISILKNRGVNARFYCYGGIVSEEYFNSLKTRVQEKGVLDSVRFLGNSMAINENLNAFDVFVMPSITEGLGISALEAQASGLQTLLSTGVPEEADMGLGLVKKIKPDDAEGWADNIAKSKRFNIDKKDVLKAFQNKGYDSKTMCGEIYKSYINMVE